MVTKSRDRVTGKNAFRTRHSESLGKKEEAIPSARTSAPLT